MNLFKQGKPGNTGSFPHEGYCPKEPYTGKVQVNYDPDGNRFFLNLHVQSIFYQGHVYETVQFPATSRKALIFIPGSQPDFSQ
jgi:hypothetical protein